MPSKNTPTPDDSAARIVAEARQESRKREQGYRERALKLFPAVCARCGREFSGKRRRELTVHHRDHNHDNNPPDGSNWELLCIYCHDNEHSRLTEAQWSDGSTGHDEADTPLTHRPFAALGDLLKKKP